MLRWCFSEKIKYLLRTIPPNFTDELAVLFNNSKKRILCSILDPHNTESFPEQLWTQCCFSTSNGGLGLKDSVAVAHSAYVASFINCLKTSEEVCSHLCQSDSWCFNSDNYALEHIF